MILKKLMHWLKTMAQLMDAGFGAKKRLLADIHRGARNSQSIRNPRLRAIREEYEEKMREHEAWMKQKLEEIKRAKEEASL